MIFWMSRTAIGSTPANGSSSRMNRGRVASARAISHAAPLAARKRQRAGVGEMRDRQVVEQRVESVGERVRIEVLQLEDGADVLGDRELAEDRRLLRQIRQPEAGAGMDRQPREIASVELDPAAVRRDQPDDHVEARRLARAVRAEQADDLAARHVQRHVVDDGARLVALLELARRTGGSPGAARRARHPRSLGGRGREVVRSLERYRRSGRSRAADLASLSLLPCLCPCLCPFPCLCPWPCPCPASALGSAAGTSRARVRRDPSGRERCLRLPSALKTSVAAL